MESRCKVQGLKKNTEIEKKTKNPCVQDIGVNLDTDLEGTWGDLLSGGLGGVNRLGVFPLLSP